ncbi:hypothetical protein SRHO_G00037360 [Serrasalmus rhombeus]
MKTPPTVVFIHSFFFVSRVPSLTTMASEEKASDLPLEYQMDNKQRGLALIFNQEHFDLKLNLNQRRGTAKDKASLTESSLNRSDAIQHVPVQRESVQQLVLVYLTAVRLVRVHSSAVRFGSALQSHTRGSMENTKPVGRVRPNKKAEQEESDDSINLSEEDLVSSHSEYEPDGSESDSESCLSLSTQLSSSSVLSKEVENGKFQTVVEATRTVSGFMASQNEYKTPSLACKIGYSLKRAAEILVGESLISGNTRTERDAKKFIEVMETQWNTYVSGRALNTLKTAKWNKDEMIPLTEDIMKLQKHLKALEKDAVLGLSVAPSVSDWKKLCQSLLTQIILFNRRREGEASKLLLATYQTRNRAPAHPEVYESLSKLEKSLVNNFTRLEIRGKRERKVPLLLTHDMEASIDILISNRTAVGICSENPFVFARISGTSHMRGSDCLRQFSLECQAKHPECLRSTRLRKHIATLCQMMNLKNSEMDQVAKFMGHDIRVHREYYRLSENTIQLAKISKLLIAIEKGNHTYLGRSLEELELDGDTLDGEKSDGECPPGEKKQKTSSRAPSPQDHLETGVEGSCGEQQSDGECLPGKKKEKRSSKASSPKDKLATCEEDSCGEEKSNRECSPVKKKQKMSSGASSQEDYLETSDKDTSAEQQSENVRSPVRKKRPSSRTQNADLVEDVETRKSDRKHTVQPRRPWTDREKEAVWRHLTKYRALKNVPGKADCLRCIQAELALKTRTWKDIKNFVYNTTEANHTDADCFVCVFLSHGDDGHVFARDNTVDIKEITALFKGNRCRSLVGKPKIFIFQACRGKVHENAVTPLARGDSEMSSEVVEEAAILCAPSRGRFPHVLLCI